MRGRGLFPGHGEATESMLELGQNLRIDLDVTACDIN